MYDGGKCTIWTQGEYDFSIRQLPPFRAMAVLGELQKIILPAISGALNGLQKEGLDAELTFSLMGGAIGDALMSCTTTVDGEKLERAARLLLDSEYVAVSAKGKKDYLRLEENLVDEIYSGRPFDMLVLCAKIFEVNFMDFSLLSSVPTGLREVYKEMKQAFREQ